MPYAAQVVRGFFMDDFSIRMISNVSVDFFSKIQSIIM